jgi:signal transduction histidine kinase
MVSFRDPKSEWLNTVAHDLKTPINSVRGCIEMVRQLGPLNEKQDHFAGRALAGLQRMEHLVARLLDISWVDADASLELSRVSFETMVAETVDMLREVANQRGISVLTEVDPRIGFITADARRLGQVLDNLLSNAIKYNKQDGTVKLTAIYEYDLLRVSVQDTGIGISEQDQPRIFERFFRSRQGVALKIEGSGLGLAITRAIIQKHGGNIWFETALGEGTTFTFTLPLRVNIGEGDDSADDSSQDLGEGRDGNYAHRANLASEATDSVDDNIQERRDHTDSDSDANDEQ